MATSMVRRRLAMAAALTALPALALPAAARAQGPGEVGAQPPRSFTELQARNVLKEGDIIWITMVEQGGTVIHDRRTTFVSLSPTAITIRDRVPIEVAEDRVLRIVHRNVDSVINGTLYGAAAGGGYLGVLAAIYCLRGDDSEACGSGLAFGLTAVGVGALVGVIVDGANNRRDVVYQAPAVAEITWPQPSRWRWAPVVGRNAYGAFFTFEFGH